MPAPMNLVSVIIPVCNQGDEARKTVARVRDALNGFPHEIIIVDDQSIDGSCHGMPNDVLVVRTERRDGVSSARRLGFSQSRGDIIIWSDPHCEFPARSLYHLAKVASYKEAIVQPRIRATPQSKVRWGGKLVLSERGLRVARAYDRPATYPALYGTIYAMKRTLYQRLKGWPRLPGIWGYSEQALTLMAWFTGTPIYVEPAYECIHGAYQPDKKFPFSVARSDPARNAHYVHALFFPKTYDAFWKPMLENHFGAKIKHLPSTGTKEYLALQLFVKRTSVRSEEEFFKLVLEMEPPRQALTEEHYIRQQGHRSKPGKYKSIRPRVDNAFEWAYNSLPPDAIQGQKALDLGTRDGYGVEVLTRLNVAVAEGIELVPETAKYANRNAVTVRQGDMHHLPDEDATWGFVSALHSLEHCHNPETALSEMARVLRPGGWLFIVVPRESSTRDRCHNTVFPSIESLKEVVGKIKGLDPTTAITSSQRQRKGRVELRLLVQKNGGRT